MFLSKLLYLILLLISVIFYILYSEILSLYLLIFIAALPVFMALLSILARFLIKADMKPHSDTSVKNSKTGFELTVKNRSPFPFSNCIIRIEYFNSILSCGDEMTVEIPVHAFSEQKVNFYLSSDYCGLLYVRIVSAKIFDFIKLFSCTIKPKKQYTVTILPEIHQLSSHNQIKMINSEESDIFSKHKSGDDPSEIFDLKEYIPGDKPNRIHWNLSLKQDDLIVRHYSMPINSSILLILDFCGDCSHSDIKSLDSAAETAFSLALYLTGNGIPFKFAYYSDKLKREIIVPVSSENDIRSIFEKIFTDGPCIETDFAAALREISCEYSRIYYVTTSEHNLNEIMKENCDDNIMPVLIASEKDRQHSPYSREIAIIPAGNTGAGIADIII